jgi:hypothetical protein
MVQGDNVRERKRLVIGRRLGQYLEPFFVGDWSELRQQQVGFFKQVCR